MTSPKGSQLEPGTNVVLSFDGTLVFVESVEPIGAVVVALPEQPDTRKTDSQVFTPGAIRAKRISPFASPDKVVALKDLSAKNLEFITTLPDLREKHGPNFVFGEAPVSVRKVKPSDVDDPTGAATPRKSRKEKRAEAKRQRCSNCSQQPGHPNHGTGDGQHEFIPPVADAAPPTKAKPSNGAVRYTLTSTDLTTAQAQSDKYAEGNRFFRVVKALEGLPNSTGTFEDIVAALCSDGGKIPSDPEKVTRRALAQLQTPAFGGNVTAA